MQKKTSFTRTHAILLTLTFLFACTNQQKIEKESGNLRLSPTVQSIRQSAFSPSWVAEWSVGKIHDMAWSPDSRMFAVNYSIEEGNELNRVVQGYSIDTFDSLWKSENSLASGLVFTPNGSFIVESNIFAPFFYWRSIESGEIIRQGKIAEIDQVKPGDCSGGGQLLIVNANENTALVADYNDLLGPRTNNTVNFRQLDLETGECENIFDYQGSFDLFDLNSTESLLAFGGEGVDDEIVIWDVKKQVEVCRTPKAEFGRFVPVGNTLAVVRGQKIELIDALICTLTRELDISLLSEHDNYLAFSPDGRHIAIARASIEIFDISTNEMLAQLPYPDNAIPISSELFFSGIKYSPDGQYLLIAYFVTEGADDGIIQLWRLKP
jgi:WD40 repeat protein